MIVPTFSKIAARVESKSEYPALWAAVRVVTPLGLLIGILLLLIVYEAND
jgi:hypothetical protein